MTEVVAALIRQGDRFMICRRPADKARGLLWEFVGGKVEPGETGEQALIRECREELDITVAVGGVFCTAVHEYPDVTIRLTLYESRIAEGTPRLLEHTDLRWITPAEIPQFAFCPADTELLEKLRQGVPAILPGVYRHFKGGAYEVIGLATHSETLELMVVYRALYGAGGLWVRPAAMWGEPVETPAGTVPRFTRIGDHPAPEK